MKREYIEMLWRACGGNETGYITAKEKAEIQGEAWADWLKKRIVATSVVPPEAFLESHGLNYPAVIRKDADGQYWAIPDPADETERFPIERSDVELFPVRLDILAHHIALAWGIEPNFKPAPPKSCLIGYKEKRTPVVMLYNQLDSPIIQTRSIKENLATNELFVISTGDYQISHSGLNQLSSEGITLTRIQEFLSSEEKPFWDIGLSRRIQLVQQGSPWGIDSVTNDIFFDAILVKVPPISEILLRALLGSIGKVVTKNELKAIVDKEHGEVEESVFTDKNLQDHIRFLRNALPEDASKWVKTASRKGYRIIPPSG